MDWDETVKLPKERIVMDSITRVTDNSEIEAPSRWEWWRVSNGEWNDLVINWLSGTFSEMAKEYGVHSEKPILDIDNGHVSIVVYGLKNWIVSNQSKASVAKYNELIDAQLVSYGKGNIEESEKTEKEADLLYDSWNENSSAQWFYFFEPVYPSSHLVYVSYGNIETHGIFCEKYKDMLDVVALAYK